MVLRVLVYKLCRALLTDILRFFMSEALQRYDFDTVLMSLNAAQSANPVAARAMQPLPEFEAAALPMAPCKKGWAWWR